MAVCNQQTVLVPSQPCVRGRCIRGCLPFESSPGLSHQSQTLYVYLHSVEHRASSVLNFWMALIQKWVLIVSQLMESVARTIQNLSDQHLMVVSPGRRKWKWILVLILNSTLTPSYYIDDWVLFSMDNLTISLLFEYKEAISPTVKSKKNTTKIWSGVFDVLFNL